MVFSGIRNQIHNSRIYFKPGIEDRNMPTHVARSEDIQQPTKVSTEPEV